MTRRAHQIRAYTGPNGGGKSLAAVHDLLPSLAEGRPVLSNTPILDPTTGGRHALWIPLTGYHQLAEVRGCDVLLDEITGVASSRESGGLPVEIANLLVQLRRRDVSLSWTTPAWGRADRILREVTQLVTWCRGYLPQVQRERGRQWKDNRLFWWRSWQAFEFDDFKIGQHSRAKVKPKCHCFFWRPGKPAERAYDTRASVAMLIRSSAGTCVSCGGKRVQHRCQCAPGGAAALAAGEAASAAHPGHSHVC